MFYDIRPPGIDLRLSPVFRQWNAVMRFSKTNSSSDTKRGYGEPGTCTKGALFDAKLKLACRQTPSYEIDASRYDPAVIIFSETQEQSTLFSRQPHLDQAAGFIPQSGSLSPFGKGLGDGSELRRRAERVVSEAPRLRLTACDVFPAPDEWS